PHVVAGAERVSCAVPEHDADFLVLGGPVEDIRQARIHGTGHGVLLLRTIELNPQNPVGTFGDDVGHCLLPCSLLSGVIFYAARSLAFGTAPLVRRPSIAFASNPSSRRISSVCSPRLGARRAGTLATPCTLIGLLMVEVSLPPASSSGTTMSFARSCGSSITSCGPPTGPKVTCHPLTPSYQCAIGCAAKTSSRIAASCGMFVISFAGSENRASVRRSARPMAFATAATLSGVTMRTNQVSSEARYTLSPALAGCLRSCGA